MVAGASRNKIYYYCLNANLSQNKSCSQNRIFESINNRSVIGLKEAAYSFFNFFLNVNVPIISVINF
jgi:hypothetical protein